MNKNLIIFGGVFLIVLDQIAKHYGVTYTDVIFYQVFVPIAFTGGLILRHLTRSS